jgi:hypothetical protein
MSGLVRPGVLAAVLCGAALALHPAIGAARWLPAQPAVLAALLVLAVLATAARASVARERRLAAAATAIGASALLAALAVDGLRGHHGALTLVSGQSVGTFEEADPAGRSLGLRPFGFAVGAERVGEDSASLAFSGHAGTFDLTPARAVSFGGYRFARPRSTTTGAAARLRIAASDAARTLVADVAPGAPGRASDLTIALDQYFPDFALDERQQPYSRSSEPRNPAALLTVERGGQSYRAFVLQSMPGVHRVEGLGLAFSLLEIEPERAAEIAVHREPAALAALFGALLLAVGLALSRPGVPAPASGSHAEVPVVVGAMALVAVLILVDGGAVLGWSIAIATGAGRAPLAGAGVLLGAALIASLGGGLLLLAGRLSGEPGPVREAGRTALWLAVLLAVAGLALATVRATSLPGDVSLASCRPLLGIAAAVAILAGSLLATRAGARAPAPRLGALALPLAALLAVGLAIALGVSGVLRDGTYATPAAASAAAAAMLGLSALEPTGGALLRRFAFLLALLALAIR